jgi:signal transduction histidine kinase
MGDFRRSATGMRWRWVLPAGAVVGVLGVLLPYQSVSAYSLALRVAGGSAASPERLEEAAYVLLVWVAPLAFLLMAAFAASWVARRAGEEPLAHGAATGIVAAVVLEVVASVAFPPARPAEAAQYLILGAVGGYLGGAEARSSLKLQEALYSASVAIGEARDADGVVRAFGESLGVVAGFDAVGLWRETGAEGLALLASWGSTHGGAGREIPSAAVREAMAAGEPVGAEEGSRLPMPLMAPGGRNVGVLVAESGERRAFGRGPARACRTAAAQAALALENIRLVEEAKEAGERAGVLVERQRLAREIHDALAQGFASISLGLGAARPSTQSLEGEARRHLEQAEVTAREGLAEARRLVWALRPEALEKRSLPEALEKLAANWTLESGVEAGVQTEGEGQALGPEVEAALLRVAQEALANARKHAGAGRVMLTLTYLDDAVVLDVRDDGAGFDPEIPGRDGSPLAETGGFGLVSMRERARELGGSLRLESFPGEGTVVNVELPLGPGAGLPGMRGGGR